MGLGGISISQLLIILLIAALLFGTKRLKNIGEDLGAALKSFRSSMSSSDDIEAEGERRRRRDRSREKELPPPGPSTGQGADEA